MMRRELECCFQAKRNKRTDLKSYDVSKLPLPVHPGDTVWFEADGTIRVGDGASECNVAGKEIDPCFETMQEAKEYCRSHKH